MLNFQNCDLKTINTEYSRKVNQFRELLLWVTDRNGIVGSDKYEMDWGNIILLMSCYGIIEVLRNLISKQRLSDDIKASEEMFNTLIQDWIRYNNDFTDEIVEEFGRQYNNSIMKRLENTYLHHTVLNEIHGFEDFINSRDTIELCNMGYESFFKSNSISRRITEIDSKIKDIVYKNVIDQFQKEYPFKVLNEFSIDSLPIRFWWRHICWEKPMHTLKGCANKKTPLL